MKLNFLRALILALSCLSFSAVAQSQLSGADNTAATLSLQACIDYALDHNITLKQSQLAIENSVITLNQSKYNKLPTVNGQYNLNSNFGRNIDPFSNEIVTRAIGTNSLGVGANMILYNGNRLQNTVDYNTQAFKAAQFDLAAQKNTIIMQVAVAYLNVLSAIELVESTRQSVEASKLQLDRTKKRVEAGSLAESNLFNLNAQVANDELQQVNAQNQYRSALFGLKQAMNYQSEIAFTVKQDNLPEMHLQEYPESVEQIYEAALNFMPEIDAAEMREKMANKNIEIAHAVGLPQVSANAGWGSTYSTAAKDVIPGETTFQKIPVTAEFQGQTVPFTLNFPQPGVPATENIPYFRQLGSNQNLYVGLGVQIPIFNGFNKKSQVQAAKIQELQAKLNTENTRLSIRQSIEQAYINMLNATKAFSANQIQVWALENAFTGMEGSYNAGAASFIDYTISKTNLDRARATLIQAKYDYLFRIKILDFYQNKPLAF